MSIFACVYVCMRVCAGIVRLNIFVCMWGAWGKGGGDKVCLGENIHKVKTDLLLSSRRKIGCLYTRGSVAITQSLISISFAEHTSPPLQSLVRVAERRRKKKTNRRF